MRRLLVTFLLLPACAAVRDGDCGVFLGDPVLTTQQVFAGERFPNVVVTTRGTVLVTWGSRHIRARRSEDGGATWGEVITIADPGFQGGGTTVDETTGDVLAFVEAKHPPAPVRVYRSRDDGRTWQPETATFAPDSRGHLPSMHMNEGGITLQHGPHRGRLLRPSRFYAGLNASSKWPEHYTNAVYSDDGGRTWRTSEPFPAFGTGEAAVAELSDGRIYYNSRRHWAPPGVNPRRRWIAWSDDGGASFQGLRICEALPDGPQDRDYGCMGGLVRLPIAGRDILLYSNCDSPEGRHHGTVWASFDGGRTWPIKRLAVSGAFAYSSLAAGRPGTGSEGFVYLFFEGGGGRIARFNLSWVLGGVATGDGAVPAELAAGPGVHFPSSSAIR